MKNIKFGIFFVGLVVAIGGAISVISAQDVRVAPRGRGDVMVLDGRGAQLGVRVSDVDAKSAGVRIDEVNEDSPAARAGVQEGDVVVEYDGERVRSARQFTRLVQETPDGRTVKLALLRNGQKQTLDVTPEAGRMSWNFGFDGDQLKREIERGMREFQMPPEFGYRYDDRGPRRFEYRMPERVLPFISGRGRLGVSLQSLTRDLEEYFGATNGGVLVSSVEQNSPAGKAGLKAGDVITSINGRSVRDPGDVMSELADADNDVTLVVLRDKKEMTLKATISRQ